MSSGLSQNYSDLFLILLRKSHSSVSLAGFFLGEKKKKNEDEIYGLRCAARLSIKTFS